MSKKSLSIWIVTDNKPGHLNQLKGLCERLAAHHNTIEKWISIEESNSNWLDCLLGRYDTTSDRALQGPDIIIGAGHSTHKEILTIKRAFNCFAVVLMKPSIPRASFNAAIIPEHDKPTLRDNTLITKGVLNTISPRSESPLEHQSNQGVILIGGESKHYHWDSPKVAEQVIQVINNQPNTLWTLSNSRRTPPDFMIKLNELLALSPLSKLNIIPHTETPPGWVKQQMQQSSQIWVTPDSVSMVYEAITSGAATGLFEMLPSKQGRIVKGIKRLIDEEWVTEFSLGLTLHYQNGNHYE